MRSGQATRSGGPRGGIQRDHDLHHQHVAQHGDDAGQDRGHEQLADRLLGQDGIDHQRHGRRDHDAQGAAGGQRTRGQRAGIAIALEFGQRHLAHGRRRCQGRTADRPEAGAGAYRRHRDAALAVPDEGADEPEQGTAQAAMGGELAHQQEQRNHHQVVVGKPGIGEILQRVEQRAGFAAGQIEVSAAAGHEHGDADRHAQHQQHQQETENHEADLRPAHDLAPRAAQVCTHM